MGGEGKCRHCGRPVLWFKTTKGKNLAVDAEPKRMATVMKDGETVWIGDAYDIHWDTCPAAHAAQDPSAKPQQHIPREQRAQREPDPAPAGRQPDDDIPF